MTARRLPKVKPSNSWHRICALIGHASPWRSKTAPRRLKSILLALPAICGMVLAQSARPLCTAYVSTKASTQNVHCCNRSTAAAAGSYVENGVPADKEHGSHSGGCCPAGCPDNCPSPCCAAKPYPVVGWGPTDLLPALVTFAPADRAAQVRSATLDSIFHPPRA
jgi:hypothetical protein